MTPKFLKLRQQGVYAVYETRVNFSQVSKYYKSGNFTSLDIIGDDDGINYILETPEEIDDMLGIV